MGTGGCPVWHLRVRSYDYPVLYLEYVLMKRSIEWHNQCLANHSDYIKREQEYLTTITARLSSSIEQYNFRKNQVEVAIKCGKEVFDAEKYLVKRVVKHSV